MLNRKTAISRTLRKNSTPWERKLWSILKDRQLNKLKFRRQHKVDKYIVDFYCAERRLIIELDGGHHDEEINRVRDLARQKYLENQGYRVLRFWNTDVDNNLEGVVQMILQYSQPHPSPLPDGRGRTL